MTIKDLLDLLYQMQESGSAHLDWIKPLNENDYELSIYSDWGDGGRFYSKTFIVDVETGATTPGFDDIKWDIEVMYKEKMKEKELQNKRQAVLNKLTEEERNLLGL